MRLSIVIACLSIFLISCGPTDGVPATTNVENKTYGDYTIEKFAQLSTDNSAHWVENNTFLLPQTEPKNVYVLFKRHGEQLEALTLTPSSFPPKLAKQYPHLAHFKVLTANINQASSKKWLKDELFIVSFNSKQQPVKRAFVQTAGVIDSLYTAGSNDANETTDLGAKVLDNGVQFKLWAPTATSVSLLVYNQDKQPISSTPIAMNEDSHSGIWSTQIAKKYTGYFYRYQLEIYHPTNQKITTITTTDPYSLSLSTNSEYSHIVDLSSATTEPDGWNNQADNRVSSPEDNIFYETHIRDFSAHDNSLTNTNYRGKYKAFTEQDTDGIKHLKSLRDAGINNIHLLPTFDIGTINEFNGKTVDINDSIETLCQLVNQHSLCAENKHSQQTIAEYLSQLPKDSSEQQHIIEQLRGMDNYNWGYDPFHYTVPEGSYAVNPDGTQRIIEFREMILALHNLGFRVIMDVVYNHTHQAQLEPTAVLDKIVPNYYHRLDPITGEIAQSTCCDNTATEHVMMEKLMIDSLVVWARDYKIDGFRFDLMAHQPMSAMLNARDAVRAVDADTYFYGEGWNFGEVANNERFVQASQLELAGTEIGTFTDRLRDAVRGGAFTATGKDIRKDQGIGNGLGTLANELNTDDLATFTKDYLLVADRLRIGLAGNLANFQLVNARDEHVTGKDIPYGDQPTGYALDPADTINYVSKHDNQTLWDNSQYRLPFSLSTDDRVRLHLQSLSFAIFAQGIPFLHMGSELLRSKSFLRDSYDYGDWFNKVDFSKQDNNYMVGLPPAEKDQDNWSVIKGLVKKNQGRDHVTPAHIQYSASVFNELIKIRMGSPLFRLTNAQEIIDRVQFLNTGSQQQQGLIVMSIRDDFDEDGAHQSLDANYRHIVVIFNTSAQTKHFRFKAQHYQLHPVQQQGQDTKVKQSISDQDGFTVPGLTTAVFVERRTP
ncbi:pullulanase-type alpha-1,6-glucosidase [Colwelliaceae bacterium 6471]